MQTHVIDLGGSLVAPDKVDIEFVRAFRDVIERRLENQTESRVIVVVGGGALARDYQQAGRSLVPAASSDGLDWIGVAATRVNAQLLALTFGPLCRDPVVTDPTQVKSFDGRVLVGSGWKPGFSTDYDAVLLAEAFGATELIRLSNVEKVYTGDPGTDPTAQPLEHVTWADYRRIIGEDWTPGKSGPLDPVAARKAQEVRLRVVFASGRRLDRLEDLLAGRPTEGTVIGPD